MGIIFLDIAALSFIGWIFTIGGIIPPWIEHRTRYMWVATACFLIVFFVAMALEVKYNGFS